MVLTHEAKWKIGSDTEGMLGGDATKASASWWEVGCEEPWEPSGLNLGSVQGLRPAEDGKAL